MLFCVGMALVCSCVATPRRSTSCELPAQRVPYCELIRNADTYHGSRVITVAIWVPGFHSDWLTDDSCSRVGELRGFTITQGQPAESSESRSLYALLKAGSPAVVELVGVFYVGLRDGPAGPDGQPYGIVVEQILSVSKEPASP